MGQALLELIAIGILSLVDYGACGSCSAAKLCCDGRDSGCVIQKASPNAIIEGPQDKPCYCDHACLKLNDCCSDFRDTCRVVDCTVSEWREWSACGDRCGVGVQTRTRSVLQPANNGGKHCPQLEQSRTCHSFAGCNDHSAAIFHRQKGTEICAFCRTEVGASSRCPGHGGARNVGIGRWKIMPMTSSSSWRCHGKWIGGLTANFESGSCDSATSCLDPNRIRLEFV